MSEYIGGSLDREKVEALVDEGDICLAEFEATDSWGSGGLVPAREQAVTRFLDALEACVVPSDAESDPATRPHMGVPIFLAGAMTGALVIYGLTTLFSTPH